MSDKGEKKKFKARVLAEKLLVTKTPNGTLLRDRRYLYDAMKVRFGLKDDDELTEEEFRKKLSLIEKHGGK